MSRPYEPEAPSSSLYEDEDSQGLATTQEQIRDVYFAGTSDGIVFLADGRTKELHHTDGAQEVE